MERRRSFWQALGFAWSGFQYAWRTQGSMRMHVGIGLLVLAVGRWLQFEPLRLAVLTLAVGQVIVAEWVNTAVERTVDLVTTEPHPLAGLIKDVAAAAVLWTGVIAAIVGLLLFVPEIDRLLGLLGGRGLPHPAELVFVGTVAAALILSGWRG